MRGLFAFIHLVCLLLCCASAGAAQTVEEIEITGIKGELKENVALYLAPFKGKDAPAKSQLTKQVNLALNALGYYKANVQFNTPSTSNKQLISVNISAGVATKITALNYQLKGAGKKDSALQALFSQLPLKKGAVLNQQHYAAAKTQINETLAELGYFDAKWLHHQLAISLANNSATVDFAIDVGQRYQFGQIVLDHPTAAQGYVMSLANFTQGEPYQASKLPAYNFALTQTPYFSSARVYADIQKRADQQVPIHVSVLHKPTNSFEVGGGFSTDTGPKVRFKWSRPWLGENGHYFDMSANLAKRNQNIEFAYTVPVDDPINDVWRYSAGYKLEDVKNAQSNSKLLTMQLQRQWLTQKNWVRIAFLRFEQESYRLGEQDYLSRMILPGVSYTRKRSKGGANPYQGQQWLLSAEFGLKSAGSSTDVIRARLRYAWLHTYFKRHMLFTRATLGATKVNNIEDLPLSMRFYAGGDQSVRGYGYKSISPEKNNAKTGGKYLASGTLEYNYQFAPSWRAAVFVDAGTATNDFSESLAVGTGVGLRYLTPVGPIRLDYAWRQTGRKGGRFSITIGPQL